MTATSFLLLLLLVASSVASLLPQDVEEEWEEWKEEHVKVYGSRQEEDTARAAWRRNRDYVIAHNNRADVTFALALNQFADVDLTQRKLSSHRKNDNSVKFSPEVRRDFLPRAPPVAFDWRTKGVIPPVRNTSSVVGTYNDVMESVHAIRTGQLVNLSTGELKDCCIPGPDPILDVFECVHKHGGLCSEAHYPNATGECRNNSCTAVANDVKRTDNIRRGDEDSMVTVVLLCPLIVNINARNPSFVFYQSGVFDESSCSQTDLDQTMLLVGYGQDSSGTPYWILKNDWGVKWGIEGYILMKRGENMCGVAMSVSFPQ